MRPAETEGTRTGDFERHEPPPCRGFNQAVVLDAIRTHGPVSRVELAMLCGLTNQTVSNVVRRLLVAGLVTESGHAPSKGGKRRTLLSPRAGVTSAVANGCLYLIGGEGNDADPMGVFNQNELYDPGTNSWRSLAPMPTPRHGITGAAFLDGWIYLPGGATRRGVSGQDVTLKLQAFRAETTCTPAM